MSEVPMTDIETVREALDKYAKNPRMGEPSARAALSRIERAVEAAEAVETAWTTGHIRRSPDGGDASTIRGRDAMKRLRLALGALSSE